MQQQQKQQQPAESSIVVESNKPPTATTTTSATTTAAAAAALNARRCPNFGQASAKIQLKQQKFLAAAAKSATSPPAQQQQPAVAATCEQQQANNIPPDHQHQNLNQHHHQQQQQWQQPTAAGAAVAAACCPVTQAAACQSFPQQQLELEQQSAADSAAAANPTAQRAYAPQQQQLRQSSTSARPSPPIDAAVVVSSSTNSTAVAAIAATTSTTTTKTTPAATAALAQQQQLSSSQQRHQQQHQLHNNFNINNNNNNNNNNYHPHYNYHYHHYHNHPYHHHHNQQHQHQQQYQQQHNQHHQPIHNMAHYKFHNDCQSSVLTYEQVKRLDFVMDQTVPIHGRGIFPTLYIKLKELIRLVKYKLQREHSIEIRDVRLNGGAASYVLAPENSHYNDLDLIFGTDLSDEDQFDVIRDVVLECLKEFIPKGFQCQSYQMPLNSCSMKEAYVHKMVKVNDDDRWSLISLGVQQSEANSQKCCSQTNCSIPASQNCCNPTQQQESQHIQAQQQQQLCQDQQKQQQLHLQQQQQFAVTLTYESEPEGLINNQPSLCEASTQENHIAQVNICTKQQQQHHLHQVTYVHHEHQRNHYQQQEQFPNSIELKFVDRMRRKFEFSVDSFQIILDSLIQFYDYAPQSTITSQRKLINSHPSSTMINTRPLIGMKRCTGYCGGALRAVLGTCETNDNSNSGNCLSNNKLQARRDNYNSSNYNNSSNSHQHENQCQMINGFPGSKQCASLLNGSRSYYQLPIEPANSASISSVASSSGCSSSSSVVSSSSSSLSCDDDHEDLYCDVDGPTSSSASTSSLLSSTNLSVLSSEGACNVSDFKGTSQQQLQKSSNHDNHHHPNYQAEIRTTILIDDRQEPKESGQIDSSTSTSNKENDQPKSSLNGNEEASQQPLPPTTTESVGSALEQVSSSANSTISSAFKRDLISAADFSKFAGTADDCVACCLSRRDNLICCGGGAIDFEMNHRTSCAVISENFYPTVIGRSEFGNFKEALYHLEKKLIATRSPEEIRGGGLLKYCNLLVKNYKPTNVYQIRTLERYMCSRFFIDFSDLNQQQAKLESYLANHFSDDPILKFDYLTILHNVVQRSTVCLMNHELRLTLNMIRDLAYKLNEQQQQQHPQLIFGRK